MYATIQISYPAMFLQNAVLVYRCILTSLQVQNI